MAAISASLSARSSSQPSTEAPKKTHASTTETGDAARPPPEPSAARRAGEGADVATRDARRALVSRTDAGLRASLDRAPAEAAAPAPKTAARALAKRAGEAPDAPGAPGQPASAPRHQRPPHEELIDGSHADRGEKNTGPAAAIKAGLSAFGTHGLFAKVEEHGDGGVSITTHDGYETHLSKDDRDKAKEESRFTGNEPRLLSHFNLAFGVMANKLVDWHGLKDVDAAYDLLHSGVSGRQGAALLGLGPVMKEMSAQKASEHEHGVITDASGASAYASRGHVERNGEDTVLQEGLPLTDAFRLEPEGWEPGLPPPSRKVDQEQVDAVVEHLRGPRAQRFFRAIGDEDGAFNEKELNEGLRRLEDAARPGEEIVEAKVGGKPSDERVRMTKDEVNALNYFAKTPINNTTMFRTMNGVDSENDEVSVGVLQRRLAEPWPIEKIKNDDPPPPGASVRVRPPGDGA